MQASADRARYDGLADWYDEQLESAPHRHQVLRAHLPTGIGPCLDVGCGTGRDLAVIAEFGWTPIGLELSADQLRLARSRGQHLVQADAERLPVRSDSCPLVVRILRPAGRFLFYGVHPCFNGPHVENGPDRSRIVHASYADASRHMSSPWWGVDGIRTRAGGMRHLPLAQFINAFLNAGLQLTHLAEPDEEPVPYAIVVIATKRD